MFVVSWLVARSDMHILGLQSLVDQMLCDATALRELEYKSMQCKLYPLRLVEIPPTVTCVALELTIFSSIPQTYVPPGWNVQLSVLTNRASERGSIAMELMGWPVHWSFRHFYQKQSKDHYWWYWARLFVGIGQFQEEPEQTDPKLRTKRMGSLLSWIQQTNLQLLHQRPQMPARIWDQGVHQCQEYIQKICS